MKRILIPLLTIISLVVTACGNDEPTDQTKEIMMSVSSETGFMYDLFDTERRYPIECMLVMSEDDPDVWVTLGFGRIEGFTYERGHQYYLQVKRTILANPPQDDSNRRYTLVRILDDRKIVEPETPKVKEINTEADIEYYDSCPINKYEISSVFTIDESNNISTSDFTTSMPYDLRRIYLENILDKADPNFIKYNSVPYMAIYSYVISPLTDEIRLIPNNSHGPMFKEVVPEEEFEYICNTLKSGEELKYALVLANIEKKGLQRVEFTITKK